MRFKTRHSITKCKGKLVTHKRDLEEIINDGPSIKEVINKNPSVHGPWIFVEKVKDNRFVVTAVVLIGHHYYGPSRGKLLAFKGTMSEDPSGRGTIIDGGFSIDSQLKFYYLALTMVVPAIIFCQWLKGCVSPEVIGPVSVVLGIFALLGAVLYLQTIGPKRRIMNFLSDVLDVEPVLPN